MENKNNTDDHDDNDDDKDYNIVYIRVDGYPHIIAYTIPLTTVYTHTSRFGSVWFGLI